MQKFSQFIIIGFTAGTVLLLGFFAANNLHSGPTFFLLLGYLICLIFVVIGVLGGSIALIKSPELRNIGNASVIFLGLLGILISFLPSLLSDY